MNNIVTKTDLIKFGYSDIEADKAVTTIQGFVEFLKINNANLDDKEALAKYCKTLIDSHTNDFQNIRALAILGRLTGSQGLVVNALEMLDGAEALGNLRNLLSQQLGENKAEKYFENVRIPKLGESNEARPKEMAKVIQKLETDFGQNKTASMIGNCLRDLDDSWYEADKKLFEVCGRDIPIFVKAKGDRLLNDLIKLKNENKLYFTQPITDEVIEFVKANPEIHYGVLDGNYYYDTKIPHQTAKMLAETDPVKRRYHYCHCPWVKESLREGKSEVPPVFCNCSAGFHKRMWEVVLGHPVKCEVLESVLKGDDRCRFRVVF